MYLSLTLENAQSVARDHLANERTFLAWVRTGLTFASVGVALAQLFRIQQLPHDSFAYAASTVIGSLFVACGMLMLIMGTFRYFHVQSVLQQGQFPATRATVWLSFTVSMSLVIVALAIILKVAAG